MSEAIRHNLDQLKEKQYALGFHMKAGSVVSTFKDSPLNLCYHFKENFSVLYLASEETKENARTFFEQLIPNCTEFHVL